MSSLKRQLEQKWRALDNFENSVRKLEATRVQWRAKYATKEGELDAAKVSQSSSFFILDGRASRTETDKQARNADLSRQLSSATHSSTDSTQIRSLTERALSAEKRAQHASNQLGLLEAKLAEIQGKAGRAEDKWEARVKEYENRLRIAGEKIKTEKQGGKERAMQLEGQVR
jgi:hypothetical protein